MRYTEQIKKALKITRAKTVKPEKSGLSAKTPGRLKSFFSGTNNRLYSRKENRIVSLVAWVKSHKPKEPGPGVWEEFYKICSRVEAKSGAEYERLKDQFAPVAPNSDIYACFMTGVTIYRYGIFQITDTSANFPSATLDAVSDINDFGLFSELLTLPAWQMLASKRGNEFRKIRDQYDEQYARFRSFRLNLLLPILDRMYKDTNNEFAKYAAMALRKETLPQGVGVVFPDISVLMYDPHFSNGGKFAVSFSGEAPNGAKHVEIHECNGSCQSIFRTYLHS